MKIQNLLVIVFLFSIISVNAQFVDDMESYTDGQPIYEGHWIDWGCYGTSGCPLMSSSAQARSGSLSGLVTGNSASPVLDLGNKIVDFWGLEFYMYIPSGKEAYWSLHEIVPLPSYPIWMVGNIFFNEDNVTPGEGYIDYGTNIIGDETFFNFPHDEWFRIVMNFDLSAGISLATWQFNVDGVDVVPAETVLTNDNGDIPTSLGGMLTLPVFPEFNEFYVDDFQYVNAIIDVLTVDDHNLNAKGFFATPNPVSDFLHLKANETITEVIVYNLLGQKIKSYKINSVDHSIDMSSYDNGVYFLKVRINNVLGFIKIIK